MTVDPAHHQAALVEQLRASGVLTQPDVAAAFLAVPRHVFLPGLPADEVYRDEAIPIKLEAGRAISSSSQPAMMAIMLEQLDVAPGQTVLEIGAGSGYNAALLGQLVGPAGQVVSIDIEADLVLAARDHLAAAGAKNVQVVCTDGVHGYPPGAPYDRIILTVGAGDIAPAWHDQLRPGGRLVLPQRLASGPQVSVAFDLAPPGVEPRFVSRSVRDCAFMPLRGMAAEPEVSTSVLPGVELATNGPLPAANDQFERWLTAEPFRATSDLWLNASEAFGGLRLWLSLQADNLASLTLEDEAYQSGRWPSLFHFGSRVTTGYTLGLVTLGGLALLDRGSAASLQATAEPDGDHAVFELDVVAYGPRGSRWLKDCSNYWLAGKSLNDRRRPACGCASTAPTSPTRPWPAKLWCQNAGQSWWWIGPPNRSPLFDERGRLTLPPSVGWTNA